MVQSLRISANFVRKDLRTLLVSTLRVRRFPRSMLRKSRKLFNINSNLNFLGRPKSATCLNPITSSLEETWLRKFKFHNSHFLAALLFKNHRAVQFQAVQLRAVQLRAVQFQAVQRWAVQLWVFRERIIVWSRLRIRSKLFNINYNFNLLGAVMAQLLRTTWNFVRKELRTLLVSELQVWWIPRARLRIRRKLFNINSNFNF